MRIYRTMLLILLGAAVTGAVSRAALPSLDWYTMDAGSTVYLAGRGFEMAGTVGQPEAGAPLTGRGFELTGGFWFAVPPGDCNSDGGVNLIDYSDFEACLYGPGMVSGDSMCPCFDQDHDGDVDLVDFAFVQSDYTGSAR